MTWDQAFILFCAVCGMFAALLMIGAGALIRKCIRSLPRTGDIVPCRICGSVEPGHDQCGEGMQLHYEWRL